MRSLRILIFMHRNILSFFVSFMFFSSIYRGTLKRVASISIHYSMEYSNLKRQAASMKQNLFDQGYLDEQFNQLEELQDEVSPNFVEEVVSLFFKDSSRVMANIEQALENKPQDFRKLDSYMQQFKGSSSSIGASKLKSECIQFHEKCEEENIEGCMRSFQKVKREHGILKKKLEAYFQLLRQVGPGDRATCSSN